MAIHPHKNKVCALVFASIIAVAVSLGGCGSSQGQDVDIRGQLALAGNGKLPENASARISLVQQNGGESDARIVAERTLHDLKKLPVKFDFAVGSQLLGADGRYGLRAQVMDKRGTVRWETPVPQTVTPRQANNATLLMLQPKPSRTAATFEHYRCDDTFRFSMARQKEQAVLRMGQRKITLPTRTSGSNQTAIYADDHGNQVIFGHDKMTLKLDGTSHMNCASDKRVSKESESKANDQNAAPEKGGDSSDDGA